MRGEPPLNWEVWSELFIKFSKKVRAELRYLQQCAIPNSRQVQICLGTRFAKFPCRNYGDGVASNRGEVHAKVVCAQGKSRNAK
jgi:hypothetical protein